MKQAPIRAFPMPNRHFRDCPLTGLYADITKPTRMSLTGHGGAAYSITLSAGKTMERTLNLDQLSGSRPRSSALGQRGSRQDLGAGARNVGNGRLAAGHGGVAALLDDGAALPGRIALAAETLDADRREAATTASCEAAATFLAAVPPVTQPPQLKPTMASAIAPMAAPWIQGLVWLAYSWDALSTADERPFVTGR